MSEDRCASCGWGPLGDERDESWYTCPNCDSRPIDAAIIADLRQENERLVGAAKNAEIVLDRVCASFPDGDPPHPSIKECMDALVSLSHALAKESE